MALLAAHEEESQSREPAVRRALAVWRGLPVRSSLIVDQGRVLRGGADAHVRAGPPGPALPIHWKRRPAGPSAALKWDRPCRTFSTNLRFRTLVSCRRKAKSRWQMHSPGNANDCQHRPTLPSRLGRHRSSAEGADREGAGFRLSSTNSWSRESYLIT